MEESEYPAMVKEKVVWREPLSARWLVLLGALTGAGLLLAAHFDAALPDALPPTTGDSFSGEAAHLYLENITAIGPRVAGSYENEVWTVRTLVALLRQLAADAAPHNLVELDRFEGSGAFSLSFFDGMNNVYRGVQGVLARVRALGSRADEPALLLNCHFDTVPDSPGASDDGAGCAVMLELARALAAARRPLRRPVLFLFNGAEENIMQGSHAFVSTHRWARSVRAFINLEACGAGGREVLFQAGPHEPWLTETYAKVVPRPFASSLAQELFESGLLPGDTDFRVFRDFGRLSGLDFAWSANGYVYHTALDTAARVPPAALQRTGDNVLALIRGLVSSQGMQAPPDLSRQPVYFDVLGLLTVLVSGHAAAGAAALGAALVLANVAAQAGAARRALGVRRAAWWRAALRGAAASAAGAAAGGAAAAGAGLLLAAAGAPLAFYSRSWLLVPLAAMPAVTVSWLVSRRLAPRLRGWWGARALRDGQALAGAAGTACCAAAGLRSGYLPLVAVLCAAAADRAALSLRQDQRGDQCRLALWALSAALPSLQVWYLLLSLLATVCPMLGRAGSPPVPADVLVMVLCGVLALAAAGWLQPVVLATRPAGELAWTSLAITSVTLLLVATGPLYSPYSAERPQRLFLIHTRRTIHAPLQEAQHVARPVAQQDYYWVPELDANTGRTVREMAKKLGTTVEEDPAACSRYVYCGAPYYLPVRGLVPRGYWLPLPPLSPHTPPPPTADVTTELTLREVNETAATLHVDLTGPNHVVVIVSPPRGTALLTVRGVGGAGEAGGLAPLQARRWGEQGRDTYFLALHAARPDHPASWNLTLELLREDKDIERAADGARWASLSIAGHALATGHTATHTRTLSAAAPAHAALTGWPCQLQLYVV